MNKKSVIIVTIVLALLGFTYFLLKPSVQMAPSAANQNTTPPPTLFSQVGNIIQQQLSDEDNTTPSPAAPTNPYDVSLKQMTSLMGEAINTNMSANLLIKKLESYGLKPQISVDRQAGIPTLTMIRTERALPGLRYIHVQFDGEGDQQRLQHFSFEIPKGPQAREKAVQFLKAAMPLKEDQKMDVVKSMTAYRHNGYVVWAKNIGPEDLDNPYNARDKNDIDNVIVTTELDIHPQHADEH